MRFHSIHVVGAVVFTTVGIASAHAATRYWQSTTELKRQWLVLEEECRGGQHEPTDAICTERDKVSRELELRGVCWVYSDWHVYPTEYKWHPCAQPRPIVKRKGKR